MSVQQSKPSEVGIATEAAAPIVSEGREAAVVVAGERDMSARHETDTESLEARFGRCSSHCGVDCQFVSINENFSRHSLTATCVYAEKMGRDKGALKHTCSFFEQSDMRRHRRRRA